MDQNRSNQCQESEERFRKVFEEGPLGIVLLGLDGQIQHCNHRFCEMLGYSEQEIIALGLADISHSEDWQKDFELGSRLLNGEIPNYTIEKRYVRKGGVVFSGQLTVSMIHDAEGKPTTVIGMVEDISERKRTEAALRESEERYRTLAESTTDVILIHDRNGVVLYGNPAGAAYIGIEPSSAIGKTQQELFSPEMIQKHTECLAEVFQTGQIVETDGMYHLGGKDIWFNSRLIPLRDEHGQVTSVLSVSRNITDRKRVEQALQQAHDELERRVEERTAELATANEELQTVYDGMVDGLLVVDLETKRFLRTNTAMCRLLGYSEEQLLSMTVMEIHPPEVVPSVLEKFQSQPERQRFLTENRPVLKKDGTVFFADISNTRISYRRRPCVIGLFRDNTERRQAQVALQENEERYKTLVETSPDAVIMADLTGHVSFVSRRLVELHGAESADEFLGKTAWDYLVPEDHEKYHQYLQKTLEDGITSDVEYTFIKKDGTRFPAELSAALVKDAAGKPVAIINVLRDITERKLAEEALRRNEERFRSYFEQGLMGMAVSKGGTQWTEVNDRFCDILGYSREEVSQRKRTDYIHPDDVEAARRDYARLLTGETDHYTADRRYIRKDGNVIFLAVFVKVFRSKEGTVDNVLGLFDDVTERKHVQDALDRERQTLWHMLQASDHERQIISYEIHDGLAQYLAAAGMQLQVFDGLRERSRTRQERLTMPLRNS